jgi:hypothetical protein
VDWTYLAHHRGQIVRIISRRYTVTCKTEGIVRCQVTAQWTRDDATKQESVATQRQGKQRLRGSGDVMKQWSNCEKRCFLRGPTWGSNAIMEHVTTRRDDSMNYCRRCFLSGPPRGFIRRASCGLESVQSWVVAVSWVGVSELVERRQLVSSAR